MNQFVATVCILSAFLIQNGLAFPLSEEKSVSAQADITVTEEKINPFEKFIPNLNDLPFPDPLEIIPKIIPGIEQEVVLGFVEAYKAAIEKFIALITSIPSPPGIPFPFPSAEEFLKLKELIPGPKLPTIL